MSSALPDRPRKNARTLLDVECFGCGRPFSYLSGRRAPPRRFCSATCHNRSQKPAPSICQQCGSEFRPAARSSKQIAAGHIQRTCSNLCATTLKHAEHRSAAPLANARAKIVELLRLRRHCAGCSEIFLAERVNQSACSDFCRQAINRKKQLLSQRNLALAGLREAQCPRCGVSFITTYGSRRFCSRKCCAQQNKLVAGANHRKRARRLGSFYEPVNWLVVMERDGWRCQICGAKTPRRLRGTLDARAPELDHRVPLALGGSHSYSNVQCACRRCNGAKGASKAAGQIDLFPSPVSELKKGGKGVQQSGTIACGPLPNKKKRSPLENLVNKNSPPLPLAPTLA
jgi:5-methylcytosine-specific restriction endonuclease McrA